MNAVMKASVKVWSLVASGALCACSSAASEQQAGVASAPLTCAGLDAAQARILGFEDASQWTPTFAGISLSSVHSEGAHSLQFQQQSGYATLTSAPLSTLALSGKAITLDALVPSPQPSWLGNITGYLDAPSRGLYGVYLGYQPFASAAPGVFQTLHFSIPDYAYTALTTGSYTDLTVRFGLALPEQSAPYLFDNLTFSTCAAPVAVSACREITTGGTYVLQNDLSSSVEGSACLSIHDASNVELDCAGHGVTGLPPLELHNVQGFSVHDCQVLSPHGFFLEVTNSSNGNLSHNTLRVPGSSSESAIVDVSNTSALSFDSNTVFGSYQQNYGKNSVISNNQITAQVSENYGAALIITNYGSQNQILNNVLDGKWDGHQPPLEFANGTDDGIVMTDEPGLSIHDNTMTNFFDCGIEWVGVIRSATIRNNHISKAGVSGIGGWYWSGLVNSTISGNTVDQSGDLFLHNRIGGLRPAGFDSQHLMPADEAVVFHDNVFDGNSLTNPSDYSLLSTNAAADIPFYDYLLDLGGIGGIPGERATTQADFQLTNNVFQNNQFGHVRLAPSFGSGTPIAGVVVDGGNNTCTSPTPAGYPLHCN